MLYLICLMEAIMKDLKVVFMGTPDFSVPVLDALIKNTNVVMVVTQPDKLVGRKKELTASPVKKLAVENNIEVFQPTKIREDYQAIIDIKPDIIITCAYGQIIPKVLLDLPKLGCVNVHASLLPKYRGGAPIHKCLIDGEDVTGVTIMYMDEGMDTGDMIKKAEYKISEYDNVGTLHEKLSLIGADLLIETLPSIIAGTCERIKQNDDEATIARVIKREDEKLNFMDTSREIVNRIRGLNPWPLAYILIDGQEVKVLEAYIEEYDGYDCPGEIIDIRKDAIGIKSNDGIVYITKIKPFGKKIMLVRDYLNGVDKNSLLGKVVDM